MFLPTLLGFGPLLVALSCDQSVILAERADALAGVGGQPALGGQGGATPASDGGSGGMNGVGGSAVLTRPTFGAPRLIEELSSVDFKDQDPTLTGDLLEIVFFSERTGEAELWTSRRQVVDGAWDPPTQLLELTSPEVEINPALSRDGLRLWFHSQREPPGIYFTERATRADPWGTPRHIDTFGGNIAPAPSSDELRLAYSIHLETGDHRDIVESVRQTLGDPWQTAYPIEGINSEFDDSTPFLIDEGLSLIYCSSRTGIGDLYWTRRPDFESPFDEPEALDELNADDALETHPHLSPDRSRIFFGSTRSGVADLYEAAAIP